MENEKEKIRVDNSKEGRSLARLYVSPRHRTLGAVMGLILRPKGNSVLMKLPSGNLAEYESGSLRNLDPEDIEFSETEEDYFKSLIEASKEADIKLKVIRGWIEKGDLPASKRGRGIRIKKKDLERLKREKNQT